MDYKQESKYKVLYAVIDDVKYRINKYFQNALYFTNYSQMLNTNTIHINIFKKEFHILNSSCIEFHRYNIYLRIRLNKAIDYFGDQRVLNPYIDVNIEFDNLKLSSLLNLRAYYIDTKYSKLYAAYTKYITCIIKYQSAYKYPNDKILNAIYKSAALHNDYSLLQSMQNIRLQCN